MADEDRELSARLGRLEAQNRVLRADLDATRVGVAAWSAVVAALVALIVPMFDVIEPDPLSADTEVQVDGPPSATLFGLAAQAADVSNGAVQTFTIITIVALLALGVAAAWVARGGDRRPLYAAGGALALVWFLLLIAVSSSGDGGAVGELGYAGSFRVVVLPLAAVLGIAAALVSSDVER